MVYFLVSCIFSDLIIMRFLLLDEINEKPKCSEVSRIGKREDSVARTIRVTVSSTSVVSQILRNASKLKESDQYQGVFIGPDRTKGERIERRKLVEALKKELDAEPSSKFVIRRARLFQLISDANDIQYMFEVSE